MTADVDGALIDGRLREYEADALTSLRDAVSEALGPAGVQLRRFQAEPVFPETCFIPNRIELGSQAGERIAYRSDGGSLPTQQVSRAFDRLGDEIDRRILATRQG